ncbi:MAG: hypothetical protein SFU53_00100 [Terrimicrobiaceae bacterium]|nr:hypothetical protein [Terrimicrobiaceae bacterium]
MFELTRREQVLVVGFAVVFLLGFGTMQWRQSVQSTPAEGAVR